MLLQLWRIEEHQTALPSTIKVSVTHANVIIWLHQTFHAASMKLAFSSLFFSLSQSFVHNIPVLNLPFRCHTKYLHLSDAVCDRLPFFLKICLLPQFLPIYQFRGLVRQRRGKSSGGSFIADSSWMPALLRASLEILARKEAIHRGIMHTLRIVTVSECI